MESSTLVRVVPPPDGIMRSGKSHSVMWHTVFEIETDYIPIKTIGRGSYGVVCSAVNRKTGEKVAIKKISYLFDSPTTAVRTLREMIIQRQIKHPNVMSLKEVMFPSQRTSFNETYMVFELMYTDLNHVIESSHPHSGDHIKYFVYQIMSGLHYIHSANVLHRDLKPSNILVNSNYELKIADFGLARTATQCECESTTEYVVTRWYRAPELLLGSDKYGTSVDVWSVGCIFAELFLRKAIFRGKNALNQLQCIIDVLGAPKESNLEFIQNAMARQRARRFIQSLPHYCGTRLSSLFPGVDPLAVDLIEKMLVFDPRKRITVEEALKHPYLKGLYDSRINCPARQFQVKLGDVEDGMEEKEIRKLMLNELRFYRPDLFAAERLAAALGYQL